MSHSAPIWNMNHVKGSCIFLRRDWRWGVSSHSAFLISGSTFFFIPSMCFCCIIRRLKRKHNLPCSVDLECEYGKHMAPLKATVLLLSLVWSHPRRGGCTDGTWRSEWLASSAAAGEMKGIFYMQESKKKRKEGRHQKWATAEEGAGRDECDCQAVY